MSLSNIVTKTSDQRDDKGELKKTIVVIGSITDDKRMLEVPKLSIAALRFTRTARARSVLPRSILDKVAS